MTTDAYSERVAGFIGGMSTVRQVYMVGSTPSSRDDEHSDLDLLVVCVRIPTAASRLRHYRRNSPHPLHFDTFNLRTWEFGTSDSFMFESTPVCVMYYTAEALRAKVDEIFQGDGDRRGFYLPTGFLSALRGARLVHRAATDSPETDFPQLHTYPDALRRRVIQRSSRLMKYFAGRCDVGLLRGDHFYAQQCLFYMREAAFNFAFAKVGRYRTSDKRIQEELLQCQDSMPEPLGCLVWKLFRACDYSPEGMRMAIDEMRPLILALGDDA